MVVICIDLGEEEEERPSLPARAITTLQKSSQFKNLFEQLEFMTNKRRMATKALVSIASRAKIECLTAETRSDRAFLEGTHEITFSDEDIKVRYPDHRTPLYLATSINQIPFKQALVDKGALVNLIPLSTLQAIGDSSLILHIYIYISLLESIIILIYELFHAFYS